jgi:GNAT superfamily N-acetyltransferase
VDMDAAARVHRSAFDRALPTLRGLHTPEEDRWFFRERGFRNCDVWGAFRGEEMTRIIAFRKDWIDQLYVLPDAQGQGFGTALVEVAKGAFDWLQLWTFQCNMAARQLYEARGFAPVRETDGRSTSGRVDGERFRRT